jgi:hypothetical protein
MNDSGSIRRSWSTYLMHVELARNHKMANLVAASGLASAPNPILEALLPSLLYIRLGALLEDAFAEYISANGLVIGAPYRSDFNGRIRFLDDQGCLKDASSLHVLRRKRNQLAHDASESCIWEDLEDGIVTGQAELEYLGLAGPRPHYEFYAERNTRDEAEPGYLGTQDYCYGLKVDGRKAIEVSWSESY